MTEDQQKRIDSACYADLSRIVRSNRKGDIKFFNQTRDYFLKQMNAKSGEVNQGRHIKKGAINSPLFPFISVRKDSMI